MAAKTDSAVTCTDKCCNIIRNPNVVHIIRTHTDLYNYAATTQNQLRNITFAKIRILIEKYSTAMPEGTGRLLQCGPITDVSLMIGLTFFANGGCQIHTSHRGSFLRHFNRLLRYYVQPKEVKHCQPSSTSFGLVDRFKRNYSATGRANCSSGRGKSITPLVLLILVRINVILTCRLICICC